MLTPQEAEGLFETLRKLAAGGAGILFISHKLDEVRALCSAATILRGGKRIASADPRDVSAATLAEMMVGESVAGSCIAPRAGSRCHARGRRAFGPARGRAWHAAQRDFTRRARGRGGVHRGRRGQRQSELYAVLSGEEDGPRPVASGSAGRM